MAGDVGREGEEERNAWSAREIARRKRAEGDKPLSPVMKTAATACELAYSAAGRRAAGKPG
jgi:hypothetical protein